MTQGYSIDRGYLDEVNFTSLANPQFDLTEVGTRKPRVQHTPTTLSAIPLREMLVIQPPLAKAERIPRTLALNPGELALVNSARKGYIGVKKVGLFIPTKHLPMMDLLAAELSDPDFTLTHGTSLAHRAGCTGPLCRRARREAAAETRELRLVRVGLRAQLPSRSARYQQLKVSVPQYAAIEPLLFSFCTYSHQVNRPANPTPESTIYLALDTPFKLHDYLQLTYQPDVEIVRSSIA